MRQLRTGKSVDRRPVSFVFVFVLQSLLQDERKLPPCEKGLDARALGGPVLGVGGAQVRDRKNTVTGHFRENR